MDLKSSGPLFAGRPLKRDLKEYNEARLARTNFESLGGEILIKQDVLLLMKLYSILTHFTVV